MFQVNNQEILYNERITDKIYLMKVKGNYTVIPGQFFMLKAPNSNMTLFRPISVFDCDQFGVSFLYEVKGKGTNTLSKLNDFDEIIIHGPYGNGFTQVEENSLLVGGGIGMAPLYYTAKITKKPLVIGLREDYYKEEEIYALKGLFENVNPKFVIGGYVTDAIDFTNYSQILTCGPNIMMEKIVEKHSNTLVSLEKHMGCGVGACLSCSCKVEEKMVKVCQDGPVFLGKEVNFTWSK